MAKKKKKDDGFVGSYSDTIVSYQITIGEISDPKNTWTTISLKTNNSTLPSVDLDFVSADEDPESYFEAPVVHLIQPLELYERSLKIIQDNDVVTVSFTIEDQKGTINGFNLVGPLIKKNSAKSKK